MTGPPPPLRFLILLLGGWTAARAFFLAPEWMAGPGVAAVEPATVVAVATGAEAEPAKEVRWSRATASAAGTAPLSGRLRSPARQSSFARPVPAIEPRPSMSPGAGRVLLLPALAVPAAPQPRLFVADAPRPARTDRWSFSAWTYLRGGEGKALAARGTLGGAQAGARIGYRLRPGLALAGRAYAPLRRRSGAEAALGLEWQPSRRLPLRLLAERRQAIGREGRSAFGVTAHGGVNEVQAGPFRLDAYAQAGLVGAKSRDGFADGAIRITRPLGGGISAGAGAWAAAQPGVSRVDLGPHIALRLPVAGKAVAVIAEWRVRVVGNARPGSGPALTIAADF